MSMLSPSRDPDKMKAQLAVFDQKKRELEKVNADWLRGRNIDQLEAQAKAALENAKAEAKALVDNSKRGLEGVEKAKGEYEDLKRKIADSAKQAEASRIEADSLKLEVERIRTELVNTKGVLAEERKEIDKEKAYLKSRTNELKAMLSTFNGSLN